MSPAAADKAQPGTCPVCCRYTGPVPTCPYCDTSIPLPPALRLIKCSAFILAIAGLIFLWLAARRLQPESVSLGELSPAMNYATIRVTGEVVGTPRPGREPGSIGFTIQDGEHRLRIFSNAAATPEQAPERGAQVSVTGNLKFSAGRDPIMFIRRPEHIQIETLTTREPSQ